MKALFAMSLILMIFQTTYAKNKRIYCHSQRKEKVFIVDGDKVAFFRIQDFSPNFRALASVTSQYTRRENNGLTKILHHEGKQHKIFIKNEMKFSDVDDFIQITSKQGHRMTYPITCQIL